MNRIYRYKKLIQPSFIQRITKKLPVENALIEINNLLSKHHIKEIKTGDIDAISDKYRVDLHSEFADRLKDLYSAYLEECLSDHPISDQKLDELNYLKNLLHLQDYEVELIHNKLGGEIYKTNYNEVIIDGKIHGPEIASLGKLKNNLRLPDGIAEKITENCRKQFVRKQFDKIVDHGRVSPKEWEEFTTLAKNLEVNVTLDDEVKGWIEKLKLCWQAENGVIPVITAPIDLSSSEDCHFNSRAEWKVNRSVTRKINYGGTAARLRIVKGINYTAGSIGINKVESEELTLIDTGQLYVTNKRIIFMGARKNINIKVSQILSITPYEDGVGIDNASGKNPVIMVSDADLLAMILSRLINEN